MFHSTIDSKPYLLILTLPKDKVSPNAEDKVLINLDQVQTYKPSGLGTHITMRDTSIQVRESVTEIINILIKEHEDE